MEIAFIDHYDSFSFNLIDWLVRSKLPIAIRYIRKDDPESLEFLRLNPIPLVLSPGPGNPEKQTATINLARDLLGEVPILGVCLGHQILGILAGGSIHRSRDPRHGRTKQMHYLKSAAKWPSEVATYNSLVVQGPLSDSWDVLALCERGEIQALRSHHVWCATGVQFHPESHLSLNAEVIRENWLVESQLWYLEAQDRSLRGCDAALTNTLKTVNSDTVRFRESFP